MSYTYYVAHTHSTGVGSLQITLSQPITTIEHVQEIQQIVLDTNPQLGWVTISNWILLSGPSLPSSTMHADMDRLRDLHARVAAACDIAGDTGDADPDEVIKALRHVLSLTRRTLAHVTAP